MAKTPETPSTPEQEQGASDQGVPEQSIEDQKSDLYSAIYDKTKDIDAPTDEDWKDIFLTIKKEHKDVLDSLHIDSSDGLRDFVLQEKAVNAVSRIIRKRELTEENAEKLLKETPDILAEAFMRRNILDVVQIMHTDTPSYFPYIERLPDPDRVLLAIARKSDLSDISNNFAQMMPHSFAMLKARLESNQEPFYLNDLRSLLDDVQAQQITLSPEQVEWLSKHAIQDDSPDAHRERLYYTKSHSDPIIKSGTYALAEEPALQSLMDVKEVWIDFSKFGREATPEIRTQARAMVSRNLYFQNLPITEANVRAEWQRIIMAREEYRDQPIFRGRNVLILAHGEKLKDEVFNKEIHGDDHARFGRDALKVAIERQQGEGTVCERVRPDDNSEETLRKTKEKAKMHIITMPIPTTFDFSMHGTEDAIYFAEGEIGKDGVNDGEAYTKITVDELVDCFIERWQNFGDTLATKEGRDIIVSEACFCNSFYRTYYKKQGTTPKAILIGSSEYDSYGIISNFEDTGSKFSAKILDVENTSNGEYTTFGDVFDNELRGLEDDSREHDNRTNPTIFIPDESNQIMQISRNDDRRKDDKKAA